MFSEQQLKLKTKLQVISIISLFIFFSGKIPHKINLLGIDLEDSNLLGCFVLIINFYLLLVFTAIGCIELRQSKKNNFLSKKYQKISGENLGLTPKDLEASGYLDNTNINEEDIGTEKGEFESIKQQVKLQESHFDQSTLKYFKQSNYLFNFYIP